MADERDRDRSPSTDDALLAYLRTLKDSLLLQTATINALEDKAVERRRADDAQRTKCDENYRVLAERLSTAMDGMTEQRARCGERRREANEVMTAISAQLQENRTQSAQLLEGMTKDAETKKKEMNDDIKTALQR